MGDPIMPGFPPRLGEPSSEVRLDLEGAFNQLVVEVPVKTPVRVSRQGFLNFVDERRDGGGPRRGSRDVGPDGAPGYRLRLTGAFNRLIVRSW